MYGLDIVKETNQLMLCCVLQPQEVLLVVPQMHFDYEL